jgi:uncharacterized membrane protein YccC
MMRPEIERVVDAITAPLDDMAHDASSLMRSGADRPSSAAAFRVRLLMDALTARIDQARRVYRRRAGGPEVANFASFIDCLMVLTLLMERPLDEPPGGAALNRITPGASEVARALDAEVLRYSLKVGFCAVAGYVIGLANQRPELSVILTTIVITALPTYGASLRKMILRSVGALLGGLISLLAIMPSRRISERLCPHTYLRSSLSCISPPIRHSAAGASPTPENKSARPSCWCSQV